MILHALSAEDSAFAALSVPTLLLPLLGAPAALAYISPDRICRFVNPVHEAWFGTAREAVAEHPGECWSAAYAQMQGDVEAALGGAAVRNRRRLKLAHGMCEVMVVCTPDKAGDGRLRGISMVMIDLDASALRERAALAAGPSPATELVLIAQLDRNYRLRFVNDGYAALFGLTAANSGGRRITDFVSSETFANLCRYAEAAQGESASGMAPPEAPADPGRRNQEQDLVAAISDITRLRRTEDQLYRREREFKTLVENSPDVIARLGRDMRHLYVSPAIETIFGLTAASCLGKTKAELGFPPPVVAAWGSAVGRAFESGNEQKFEFSQEVRRQPRYFSVRVIPEFDRGGGVESVLGDHLRRQRAHPAGTGARATAQARARCPHPGGNRSARARRIPGDRLARIARSAERHPELGARAGKLSCRSLRRPAGATRPAWHPHRGRPAGAPDRGFAGRHSHDERPAATGKTALRGIAGDPGRGRERARGGRRQEHRHHHPLPHRHRENRRRSRPAAANGLEPDVQRDQVHPAKRQRSTWPTTAPTADAHHGADDGVGMAPEFLPHMFDRFSQQDTSSTRGHSGLGLGLFLVRYLVELHGGEIRAESRGRRPRGRALPCHLPLRATPESYAYAAGADPTGVPGTLPSLAGRQCC